MENDYRPQPVEIIIQKNRNHLIMYSDYPGDEAVSELSRQYFSEHQPMSLSVIPAVNRNKEGDADKPSLILIWVSTWSNDVSPAAIPLPAGPLAPVSYN